MATARKAEAKKATEAAPKVKVREMDLTLSLDLESLLSQAKGLAIGSRRKRATVAYDGLADALEGVLELIPKK